jgi:hypothetical protein
MFLWAEAEAAGTHRHEWRIAVPAPATYEVSVLVNSPGGEVEATCGGETCRRRIAEPGWTRAAIGEMALAGGSSVLGISLRSLGKAQLSSAELVRPDVRARQEEDARAIRRRPEWFRDAGYGLMFQWTNRAAPRAGPVKPWGRKVDDFDVEAVADLLVETGASYMLWSVTWGEQYIPAPVAALDRILPGRTTERDLLGEMADLLAARGVHLIFYYHYGYDCYHSTDPEWMRAAGGYEPDKTALHRNVRAIVEEIGHRYGRRLHGWFFDGGQRYYDCHFDGSPPVGILSAPWRDLAKAARAGNDERIITHNSWILPKLTEFQDYFCGEGVTTFDGLEDGLFVDGPQAGLQAHGNFRLEGRWGHLDQDREIDPPRYGASDLARFVEQGLRIGYPLSVNLEMYEDGSVSPQSRALMRDVKSAVRGR